VSDIGPAVLYRCLLDQLHDQPMRPIKYDAMFSSFCDN
jgi:hypothetical protein